MDAQVSTTKQLNLDELTRLLGAPVTLVSVSYPFTDGVLTHSTNVLTSAGQTFGTDVVTPTHGAVAPIASKIGSGVTVTTRTDAHTLVISGSIADGTALHGSVAGSDPTLPNSTKVISCPVSQAMLNSAIAEYVDNPGVYSPQNAEEQLTAFVVRVPAVLAGSDSFSSGDIQMILAWFLVSFHGAKIGPVPTPGVHNPNP